MSTSSANDSPLTELIKERFARLDEDNRELKFQVALIKRQFYIDEKILNHSLPFASSEPAKKKQKKGKGKKKKEEEEPSQIFFSIPVKKRCPKCGTFKGISNCRCLKGDHDCGACGTHWHYCPKKNSDPVILRPGYQSFESGHMECPFCDWPEKPL